MNSNTDHLKQLTYKGAKEKNLAINEIVLDRIAYEMSIIEKRGFTDYFILYSNIVEICNAFLKLLHQYSNSKSQNICFAGTAPAITNKKKVIQHIWQWGILIGTPFS